MGRHTGDDPYLQKYTSIAHQEQTPFEVARDTDTYWLQVTDQSGKAGRAARVQDCCRSPGEEELDEALPGAPYEQGGR